MAIELLTAIQALEFRRPLKSSPYIETIVTAFRKQVSFNDADRILREDMMQATNFTASIQTDFPYSRIFQKLHIITGRLIIISRIYRFSFYAYGTKA